MLQQEIRYVRVLWDLCIDIATHDYDVISLDLVHYFLEYLSTNLFSEQSARTDAKKHTTHSLRQSLRA